ncbi:MAG TPA: efflux RND transporter periplasmic adaptor subunit [Gemmatimonadaceae bacterium]|jgi:HlyD family secretion protein|nr:efflux RND transporter periplasmic adaptor subunit [Gemmatimonadaceae bacterium]
MTRRGKAITGGVVLLSLLGGLILVAFKRGEKPVDVRLEKVQKRDLVAYVTASGQVQPHTKVDVASDVSGRIVKLSVKEGDVVKKGQFLLQIDPATYQADVQREAAGVASARADLARAKANLEQSQNSYRRSSEIVKENPALISAEQIEQLKTTVDVNSALYQAALHTVDQMGAALQNSQSSLAKTTILAPMDGRITRLAVQQGETAVPGTFSKDQALLLTISDMTVLETKVKVDETDVARLHVGDTAQVLIDAFPDTTFRGKVTEIAHSAVTAGTTSTGSSDQAVDYEVRVQLIDPPLDTRPDFSATAKIVWDSRKSVLSIPIIALTVREHEANENRDSAAVVLGKKATKDIAQKDVEGVFVVGKDSRVSFRPVKVGIPGEEYFEVLSGLQEGETVVAGSYQAIRNLHDSTVVKEMKKDDKKKEAKA